METSCRALFIFLVLVMSVIPSTTSIKERSLRKICSKTINKKNCLKLLKSDDRTLDASPKGLTRVAIDLAQTKLRKAIKKLDNNFVEEETSNNNYYGYSPCSQNFKYAIKKLELAKDHLKSRGHNNIDQYAKDALQHINKCKNGSLDDSKEVKKIINDAKLACNIVKITSRKLKKPKKNRHKKHKHKTQETQT
ncbi:hypothetical protein LIER_28185 [Lithospermum erythrorhizon]|uniref:Pectinesterase inhibitor domain-containing protein n=1 Tax=Lithospermum erythrorhizon TaxID=34254 RepID=A0AAV3RKW3_LITER